MKNFIKISVLIFLITFVSARDLDAQIADTCGQEISSRDEQVQIPADLNLEGISQDSLEQFYAGELVMPLTDPVLRVFSEWRGTHNVYKSQKYIFKNGKFEKIWVRDVESTFVHRGLLTIFFLSTFIGIFGAVRNMRERNHIFWVILSGFGATISLFILIMLCAWRGELFFLDVPNILIKLFGLFILSVLYFYRRN